MKQFSTLLMMMLMGGFAFAQNAAISACNDPSGGIQIIFDQSQNCSLAPGDLSGLDAIGFHSGGTTDPADGWAAGGSGIDWDATGATVANNDGNDMFTVYIPDVDAYYSATGIARINFVFNQGPANADEPWSSEGKDADNDGDGNCDDFNVIIADITDACATTASIRSNVVDLGISVAPNPFSSEAVISFSNPRNESYNVEILSLAGQTVRSYSNVTSDKLTVVKGDLAQGMYFATFTNEAGQRASTNLMIR